MTGGKKIINWVNLAIGILLIILNLLWIFYLADEIMRDYFTLNQSTALYLLTSWQKILSTASGLAGIILAVLLIKEKINAWKALPVNFAIICICILINIYFTERNITFIN